MKGRNAFLVWLVWPILTLGIYGLVWYYKIHKEMLQFDPRQPIKPAGSLLTIMFGWIIIVPPFISYFNTGNRIANAQRAAGLTPTANPWIGCILLFIFELTPLYYLVLPVRTEQGRRAVCSARRDPSGTDGVAPAGSGRRASL